MTLKLNNEVDGARSAADASAMDVIRTANDVPTKTTTSASRIHCYASSKRYDSWSV